MLVRGKFFGVLLALAVLGTLTGLIYGSWIDGASLGLITFYQLAFVALQAGSLWLLRQRSRKAAQAASGA